MILLVFASIFASNLLLANDNPKNAIAELESLPDNYPIDLAFKNRDVIIDQFGDPIHIGRFQAFIEIIDKNESDKVRFAKYSFEGEIPQPYIGILETDGDQIRLYLDNSRVSADDEISVYTGDEIRFREYEDVSGRKYLSYYLISTDTSEEITIFNYYPYFPYEN